MSAAQRFAFSTERDGHFANVKNPRVRDKRGARTAGKAQ
jgi:hypothetical protein